MQFVLRLILLTFVISNVGAEMACKDMDGKDVDWFVALKMPKLKDLDSVHPDIAKGSAFYYADSNNQEFRISKANINDPKSALGYTVSQAIDAYQKKSKDILYAFYNDQAPGITVDGKKTAEKNFDNRAHAKGVMAFNDKQGFWLIHSAPRYADPTSTKGYFYPSNAMVKGQSFFCATFANEQLKDISTQIFYSQYAYYVTNVPDSMAKKYPKLNDTLEGDKTIDDDATQYYGSVTLKTKGGQVLSNYEKSKKSQGDLWTNQVSAETKQSFFVESWLNGNAKDWQNSCKGKNFVKNIRSIKHELGNIQWPSASDHSKWAVSDKAGTVCIGDVNRQLSQQKRGGGCMCIENEKIWKFFRDSVDVVECCSGEDSVKRKCEAMPCDSYEVPSAYRKAGEEEREFVVPEKDPEIPFCSSDDEDKPKKPVAKKTPAARKAKTA